MRQIKITPQITIREGNFHCYLTEIDRYKLLTIEQEIELCQQIKEGDKKALQKLINSNLRFVVSVAKQYQNQGLSLEDLVNEGNIGLCIAAARFDSSRGFKFISYAVWWIRSLIQSAIIDYSLIRLPGNKYQLKRKVNTVFNKLLAENEFEPSLLMIAEHLNMDVNDIKLAQNFNYTSFDAPINEDTCMIDLFEYDQESTDASVVINSENKELAKLFGYLSIVERNCIQFYYFENKSYQEIGKILGYTGSRISQIITKAHYKLKRAAIDTKTFTDLSQQTKTGKCNAKIKSINTYIERAKIG